MNRPTSLIMTIGLALATLMIFLGDLLTTSGFAHGMLYVVIVLITMLTGWRWLILASMAVSMVLIVVGGIYSPAPVGFPTTLVIADRSVSMLVVLITGLIAITRIPHSGRHNAEQAFDQNDSRRSSDDPITGGQGKSMDNDQDKRTAQRLTTTLESITDAFLLLDEQWRVTFMNSHAESLLERSREDMLGKSIWDEFPEARGSVFETEYRQAVATGESARFEAFFSPLERWFSIHAYPSDEGLAIYFQDITAQQALHAQLQLLKTAVERVNDMIIITEAESIEAPGPRIVYVNQAFERLTGHRKSDVIGKSPRFLQGPDTSRAQLDRIRSAMERQESVRVEVVNYDRAGQTYHIEMDISPIIDEQGICTHFVAIERDVSERINLEERLRQSQRLEAVGQLTSGIAHDFNNLLTVIMGNAEMLGESLADDRDLSPVANMISNAAQRGAELTQRLLAFARRQALEPRAVDIGKLVANMDGLLQRALGDHIEIETTRSGGLWPALVDEGQLENALLNLCLNARDAMPGGGQLTIETANACLDHDYADRQGDLEPGQYVMLSVSDTGRGIEPEILARVFEPFFTTKEKHKGTGLGLSMIYGFIKQSNGHIRIYSEPGEGSTVKLYLPRADGTELSESDTHSTDQDPISHETILLVEDDEMVQEYARNQLITMGYTVLTAGSGPEAMDIVESDQAIDLLFTDVIMPGGMSGRDLADAAQEVRPDLKVLYTSGYTENAIVHHGRLDRDVHLLSKPYRRRDLVRQIQAALRDPATDSGTGDSS